MLTISERAAGRKKPTPVGEAVAVSEGRGVSVNASVGVRVGSAVGVSVGGSGVKVDVAVGKGVSVGGTTVSVGGCTLSVGKAGAPQPATRMSAAMITPRLKSMPRFEINMPYPCMGIYSIFGQILVIIGKAIPEGHPVEEDRDRFDCPELLDRRPDLCPDPLIIAGFS
jgi:hypothetical protein